MKHAFSHISIDTYMEKTILPKYLKISLDIDLKIILLDCQNNYVGRSNWLSEYNKTFCSIAHHV